MEILKDGISLFFPAYNEEANVGQTIEKAVSVIKPLNCRYEIIIVDDGSVDKTAEIAGEYSKENPSVILKRHERNLGYGEALKTGFKNSKFGLIFFSDCDLQFDLNEIILFLKLLDKNKSLAGIIGYRINRADSFFRKLNTFGWKLWCRLLFGLNYKDIDCAFKLFKREAIENIRLESSGALISAELLSKIKKNGRGIVEIGVHHYKRKAGNPSGAKLSVIIKAFVESFKLFNSQ